MGTHPTKVSTTFCWLPLLQLRSCCSLQSLCFHAGVVEIEERLKMKLKSPSKRVLDNFVTFGTLQARYVLAIGALTARYVLALVCPMANLCCFYNGLSIGCVGIPASTF